MSCMPWSTPISACCCCPVLDTAVKPGPGECSRYLYKMHLFFRSATCVKHFADVNFYLQIRPERIALVRLLTSGPLLDISPPVSASQIKLLFLAHHNMISAIHTCQQCAMLDFEVSNYITAFMWHTPSFQIWILKPWFSNWLDFRLISFYLYCYY